MFCAIAVRVTRASITANMFLMQKRSAKENVGQIFKGDTLFPY